MKKLIATLILICIFNTTRSQIIIAFLFGDKLNTGNLEFGIVVSPALTNISDIESKSRTGFNLGIYFNIQPEKRLYIHAEGIGKGSFGAKDIKPYSTESDTLDFLFENGLVERKIKVFSMPILARYRLTQLFFAEAGIQTNLRLKAEDVFKSKITDNDLQYTVNVSDQLTKFDFGIAGGFFYKFRKEKSSMGIGIRYFHGIVDTHKILIGNQVNNAWYFNITIPVGTEKDDVKSTK